MRILVSLLLILSAIFRANAQGMWLSEQRGFGWNEAIETDGVIINRDDTIIVRSITVPKDLSRMRIALLVENIHNVADKNYRYSDGETTHSAKLPPFALFVASGGDTISFEMSIKATGIEPFVTLNPIISVAGDGIESSSFSPKGDLKTDKPNLYILTLENNQLTLETGHTGTTRQWQAPLSVGFNITDAGVLVYPGGGIDVKFLHLDNPDFSHNNLTLPSLDPTEIATRIEKAADPLAGYWTMSGRALDEKYLRTGGTYTLATVPTGKGEYGLYYLSGANINPTQWSPGKGKALLKRLIHPRYDAVWIDAEGTPIEEAVAIFSDYNTLTVQFPYYNGGSITLQRIEKPDFLQPSLIDETDP